MKCLFMAALITLASFNAFAQPRVGVETLSGPVATTGTSTTLTDIPRKGVLCCYKCANDNLVVNPALNGKCHPQGGWLEKWVPVGKCTHENIQNFHRCE